MSASGETYQMKVWESGGGWRWEVKHADIFAKPFDSGWAETQKEARANARSAVDDREVKDAAPWKKVIPRG